MSHTVNIAKDKYFLTVIKKFLFSVSNIKEKQIHHKANCVENRHKHVLLVYRTE